MNQPLPLVEQLKSLVQLQEIDLKIDSLKKNKNSLPMNLKSIDNTLTKLKGSLNSKRNQCSEIEKVYKQTQAALELNQDRLARSHSKLEAVQNSQEFQAASKEIEQLKKLNTTLEDQSKKSADELIVVRKEIEGLEEETQKLQTERDGQATILSGQDSQYNQDIEALVLERAQFTSKIENRILSQYNRVRMARNGLGVVPTVGGRCKGCNMIVPPQLYNEVQRGSILHSCPSCHRILFVPLVPSETNPSSDAENSR